MEPGEKKKDRLVILGTGFAAVMILKKIDLDRWDVTVVSPRNHFLFTPLLPSTTVGTVEFRSIIEPIRKTRRGVDFMQAICEEIDPEKKEVTVRGIAVDRSFRLWYDRLVIAVGAVNNTFGIPGVEENTFFLKELTDARVLRERIVSCMEQADLPDVSEQERRRLLHFMIVGGGPTGVEFAAELHDLIDESMQANYPDLVGIPRITLFEAMPTILGSFDKDLRDYTMNHFTRQGIELRLEKKVTEVVEDELRFDDGSVEEGGLIVWSTGYAPTDLVRNAPFEKERGRLITDPFLRVPNYPDVYAAGDCAVIAGANSPQTAQFAMQAGKYLGKAFNRIAEGKDVKEFEFNDLGMLAYIGDEEALAEVPRAKLRWHGALTYLAWRSAYLTRLVSFKNKVLVLFDWIKTRVFGRDMSKF